MVGAAEASASETRAQEDKDDAAYHRHTRGAVDDCNLQASGHEVLEVLASMLPQRNSPIIVIIIIIIITIINYFLLSIRSVTDTVSDTERRSRSKATTLPFPVQTVRVYNYRPDILNKQVQRPRVVALIQTRFDPVVHLLDTQLC